MIVDADAAVGEIIWRPTGDRLVDAGVARFAEYVRERGVDVGTDYSSLWRWSVDEPARFWELFAGFAGIALAGDGGPVLQRGHIAESRWFVGRTVNFARHLLEGREGIALISVSEQGAVVETSWAALRSDVAGLARTLRDAGVGPGDRVVGILPNVAETVTAFLATVSLGAIWSVCAPEFGAGAIVSRFAQLAPKVVVAAPGYRLAGKDRDRRSDLQQILAAIPSVERVVWVTAHTETLPPPTTPPSIGWSDAVGTPGELTFVDLAFDHPLWVLFSSGTTGIPKGIVHGHGGALLELMKLLLLHSDLRPGDRYFNVASTSWVLWNSLISALGVGATAVLVDGNPTFPSVDRVWAVASQTGTTVLGVSAGFLHACAKSDLEPRIDHGLSALRAVQVTGSPLSASGYRWTYGHVGDVWLASMSGGTDIASIFVGGVPTLPVRVGFIQAPALGVSVESWDDDGLPTKGKGELVIIQPMPSMPLSFWGDDGTRYRESYFSTFPDVWRHGDFIEFTPEGIVIHGRSDSTLNRNGLRLGSADIYAAVEELPEVVEAMVVGAEIGEDGYYMPLFLHLADGVDEESAKAKVIAAIRTHLSPRYLPDEIVVMSAIPHTRTGKKLEVPVKRLIQGASLGDVADSGAVDDAEVLREYARFAADR